MDITFNIVERSIVRFVLLCLCKEFEQTVGALLIGEVIVDESDKNALALRELLEAFLKIALCISCIYLCEFSIDVTILGIITEGKALFEESRCCSIVTSIESGETCIVEG